MIPVLYSFRRCPYAMRARLALQSSRLTVELREVVLREKPEAFLDVSPTATVPCLVTTKDVIDESLDIMKWSLAQNDPEDWLDMPDEGWDLITKSDGPYKSALDRTKYANRYPDSDPAEQRAKAGEFLTDLNMRIDSWIFDRPTIADYAILPFVRQFAFIDKAWFDQMPWPDLQAWLERFLTSKRFAGIMTKYPQWKQDDEVTLFP